MAKTKTPKKSGLSVARNGYKFVLLWSMIKKCKDQDIKIFVNGKQTTKKAIDLNNKQTKYEYTVDSTAFYPTAGKPVLTTVGFSLAQKQKKKKESAFSSVQTFTLKVPGQPGYEQPEQDKTNTDTFTYSWTRHKDDDDPTTGIKAFNYFYYETCLVPSGDKPNWELAKSQKIQTIDPTTGQMLSDQNSYGTFSDFERTKFIVRELQSDITARKKRYFRIQSVGPAGASSFRQSEHQLGGSDPIKVQATETQFKGSTDTGTSGSIPINITNGNPNDSIQIEYSVAAPYVSTVQDNNTVKSSLHVPPGFDSWTSADSFSGSGVPDTYTFNLPTYIVEDSLLFMRINRIHDNITSYGSPFIMNTNSKKEIVIGRLSDPTLSAIQVNESAHEVTVVATNNAQLAEGGNRSFIAVYERDAKGSEKEIGIIPYSSSGSSSTFVYDEGATAFGIRCFVANYSPINRQPTGVTNYKISNPLMQSSSIIWDEDSVSKPPQNVKVIRHNADTALVTWDWNWAQADSAEISWSDNEITWDSIEEPSSYVLSNTREGKRYITGLSATKYYFKVRFIKTENETTSYGVYSKTEEIVMSAAPDIPTMTLSDEDNVVAITDQVTAYWSYASNDGTPQASAKLAEAKRANENAAWTYTDLPNAYVEADTKYTFTPEQFKWKNGDSHYICVKVHSESGRDSEGYSNPILLKIAPLPVMTIHGINEANTDALRAPINGELSYGLTELALKKLPIEFTVSGSGRNGFCAVVIERNGNFALDRPDDSRDTGFDNETVVSKIFLPSSDDATDDISVSITADDLKLSSLDNTAKYHMYVSITDEYGQTVSSSVGEFDFMVDWDHYAQMPEANIQIDPIKDIAIITPSAPEEISEGDFCRIYRMSADRPQLILDNGDFGETYVDPYPTFGQFGGYRIVYVTKYHDYKTEDNMIAMTEYSIVGNDEDIDVYDKFMVSLDFDGNTAEFVGNISLNNSWDKDFQLTRYLGGSMQGDWNPGVQRTGSINGTIPVEQEFNTVYLLRLLADYPGRCHVRTPEGSNFVADIQVKDDREEKQTTRLSKISLSYTKVDNDNEDMVTWDEWIKDNPSS